MNNGLLNRDMDYMVQAFKLFPEVKEVVLFGSRAKGTFKQDSDVDLALKGNNITYDIVSRISFLLNEDYPLPYYFDLISYDKISTPELSAHINRVGKIIYSNKERYHETKCMECKKKKRLHTKSTNKRI